MINKYKIEEGGSAKIVIDTVQIQLQCCGYDDMLDWRPEEVAIIGRGVSRDNVTIRDQDWLPRSCCGAAPCTQDKAFREPCKLKLRENALNPNTAIGIIGKMESYCRLLQMFISFRNICHHPGLFHRQHISYLPHHVLHCSKVSSVLNMSSQ